MPLRSMKPVLAGVALAACTLSVQANELVFNNFLPPAHFMRAVMDDWVADINSATDGRVDFEIPAGSLAPPPQQISAVKLGIADAAITANVFVQKQIPVLSYSSLPFLTDDAEAASVANWRAYDKFLAEKEPFKRHGVEVLSVFNFSGGHLYGLEDEPIQSVADLKDKRLWALPGYTAGNIKALGISPVTGPAVKISETVAKGVVDAFYGISFESVTDFKAAPYTKNIVRFPYAATSTSFSLIINQRTWSRISEKDRAAIRKLSGEVLARKIGAAAKAASETALAKMKADGIKVVAANPEFYASVQGAAKLLFDGFVKKADKFGVDGNALLDYFKAQYAQEETN